jgi:hypothetical protein
MTQALMIVQNPPSSRADQIPPKTSQGGETGITICSSYSQLFDQILRRRITIGASQLCGCGLRIQPHRSEVHYGLHLHLLPGTDILAIPETTHHRVIDNGGRIHGLIRRNSRAPFPHVLPHRIGHFANSTHYRVHGQPSGDRISRWRRRLSTSEAYRHSLSLYSRTSATWYGRNQLYFLPKSNQPTALRRPFLHPNTTPASTLCNSVSEGFQCVTVGLAIIAAMAPITWDFSSSLQVLCFHVFTCFSHLQQFGIIIFGSFSRRE